MAVVHGTGQLVTFKIIGVPPCIEASSAEIHGVGSVLNGTYEAVHTACRGKQFQLSVSLS